MGQIQSLEEFLSLLKRRRFLIGALLVIGVVLSLLWAMAQPKTFEAGAVIQVETPVVEGDAQAAGQSAQMLQNIEQRLTTRDNLIAIIDRHGLFADAPGLSVDQKVALLRRSIAFQSVASAAQQGYGTPTSVAALIITARLGNADQAARLANDLAQGVLDMSSAGKSQRARETQQFFVEEEQRVGAEIAKLEAELAAFKNRNAAVLPATRDTRRDDLLALESELRRLDQSLVAATGARKTIEKKDQLRETDRRQIDDLSVQIEVILSQKSALEAQRDILSAQIAETPEIERELSAFARQLQQLQSQYDVITAKLAEAETNLRLEEQQHSEHFTLLERAMVPEYATGGSRKKVAVFGSLASLVLAIGVAFLLDAMNPVLRTPAQMERQLDLRPMISIPDISAHKANRSGPHGGNRLKPLKAVPRYAIIVAGAILLLVVASAAIT